MESSLLTREQCREADRMAIEGFGIPSLVLMENAGRNCAEKLLWHSHRQPRNEQAVLILCGPGNNGGDGFVIARHLSNSGIDVKVILFCPPEKYAGDALTNLSALSRLRVRIVQFDAQWTEEKAQTVLTRVGRRKATWIVDALLGTGALGEPRDSIARAIRAANELNVRRLAVDIPTGLDCDTGIQSDPTFQADITCTFIDQKIGFQSKAAKPCLGLVTVVDIGAPADIIAARTE